MHSYTNGQSWGRAGYSPFLHNMVELGTEVRPLCGWKKWWGVAGAKGVGVGKEQVQEGKSQ